MIELQIAGPVISKKNSRINTRDGRSFPSKSFTSWHQSAIQQVRRYNPPRFRGVVQVEVIIYFATLGKADIDNKVTSILDMLVDALVLKDDYWESVARLVSEASYRPGKAGAFIRITELPDDFLGSEYVAASAKRDSRKRK